MDADPAALTIPEVWEDNGKVAWYTRENTMKSCLFNCEEVCIAEKFHNRTHKHHLR